MAASEAVLGYGTTFEVENAAGSGVFFELGEVTNVTPPNESVDQVEVTHMQSPDRTKEFIQGLIDPGEMSVEINWIPGNATDDFLVAWRTSGETRSSRIVYTDDNLRTDTFPAFMLGFTPTMGAGEKLGATVNLKVAGAVSRS